MEISKKKMKRIVIALTAIILVCTIVVALVLIFDEDGGVDYLNDDLSQYVTISESDYKGYEISIPGRDLTDNFVEREIMRLRYNNRSSSQAPAGVTDVAVDVGHTVYIYYRGYLVEDDGSITELGGSSNTLAGEAVAYGVGSFSLSLLNKNYDLDSELDTLEIIGFDEGLVGAIPRDHILRSSEVVKSGKLMAGDEAYLILENTDGSCTTHTVVIGEEGLDAKFGSGFSSYLEGRDIGATYSDPEIKSADGERLYSRLMIGYALRCEAEPLKVEVEFPSYYQDRSLRGKEAVFEVYFKYSIVYDAPEYENEEFITETLKIKAEDLGNYDGANLVEKHNAKLRIEAEEKSALVRETLIEEAVWDRINSSLTVIELPISEVEEVYNERYGELYLIYLSNTLYASRFGSVDAFCVYYYGLNDTSEVAPYIKSLAEGDVREKLAFYYIMRQENLVPNEETVKARYDELVSEYLDDAVNNSHKSELEGLTESKREERILEIKDEIIEYYGEDYFLDIVYYEYVIDDIIGFAIIK